MIETVFCVPKLNQASVIAGACCPVPAEAILLPELELIPGVQAAEADWHASEIRVQHAPEVDPAEVARVLEELSYPAESWSPAELHATGVKGAEPPRREAAFVAADHDRPHQAEHAPPGEPAHARAPSNNGNS